MTGLVYRSYTTSLDSLHRIGRPFHPHHHHPHHHHHILHAPPPGHYVHLQEKPVDLRGLTMLEENNTIGNILSPMYPVSPTKDRYTGGTGGGGGTAVSGQKHQEERHSSNNTLDETPHEYGGLDQRSPLPGDTGGVNHTPQQDSRSDVNDNDPSNHLHVSVDDDPVALDMTLEEGRRLDMMSPVSNASSDMEDDVTDNISCGKSDSSAESPNGKQRRSGSGDGGSGNGGGGGSDKKVYRCQHCKYVTDRKNNLKRHVVTMHELCTKTLECCDVLFKNKASLRDHVVSCHKNGYDCRTCGRTFCRKALLKRHITVHSGQKDYICGVCGYATSHKSNLDRHKRRHGPKYGGEEMEKSSPPQTVSLLPNHHNQHPAYHHSLHHHPEQQQHQHQQLPQNRHFTPLKSNPLDVSNLVSNHGNSPSNSHLHPLNNPHHIPSPFASFLGSTLHRPEPVKAEFFPGGGPHLLAGISPEFPATDSVDRWPSKRHRSRANGRHILAKRLLYTYRKDGREGSENKPLADVDTNLSPDQKRQRDALQKEPASITKTELSSEETDAKMKLVLKTGKSVTAKRLLTKRLFPTLYMCRRCSVVYENQLQLTGHIEKDHKDEDCPQVPQRPLTLQARPRAW